jgi:hypothetical protein
MRAEAIKLEKGVNLLVATPGRLLDHLMVSKLHTDGEHFSYHQYHVSEHQRLHISYVWYTRVA